MQYSLFLSCFGLSFVWAVSSAPSDKLNTISQGKESADIDEKDYIGRIPYYHGKSDYKRYPESGMTCGEWTLTKAEVDREAENACKEFRDRRGHLWIRTKRVKGLYYSPEGKSKVFKKRHYMYPLQNQQSIKRSETKPIPYIFIDNSCKPYAIYIRSKIRTRRFALFSKSKFRHCWDARTGTVEKIDNADPTAGTNPDGDKTTIVRDALSQSKI